MKQLGAYLGNAEQESELFVLCDKRSVPQPRIILTSIDVAFKYLPLIDVIIKRKHAMYYNIRIYVDQMKDHRFDIVVKAKSRRLFLSYTVDTAEFETKATEEEQLIEALVHTRTTYGDTTCIDAKELRSMEFVFEAENGSIEDGKLIQILQSALATCPLLEFISFSSYPASDFADSIVFGSTSDMFGWFHHQIDDYQHIYPYYCNCEISILADESTTTTERLQYALFNGARIQTATFKLLTDLLRNMKILKLHDCELEEDDFSNYTLDIRGVIHLNELELEIDFVDLSRRHFFIKVEMYDNYQETCFKADNFMPDDTKIKMNPTTVMYMNSYNRFKSLH